MSLSNLHVILFEGRKQGELFFFFSVLLKIFLPNSGAAFKFFWEHVSLIFRLLH